MVQRKNTYKKNMVDAVQLGSALSGSLSPNADVRTSSENIIEHVRDTVVDN